MWPCCIAGDSSQLWRDKFGQVSLATTTLFWGAGATLQFIVLKWAEVALGYSLSQATMLQGICALGIAVGAVIAARFIPLNRAVDVVPVGIAMGIIVIAMVFAGSVVLAIPLMFLLFMVQGRQDKFFVDLLAYCDAHLISRLRAGAPEEEKTWAAPSVNS